MDLFKNELSEGDLTNFAHLSQMSSVDQLELFQQWIKLVTDDIDWRFKEIEKLKPLIKFGEKPWSCTNDEIKEVCKLLDENHAKIQHQMLEINFEEKSIQNFKTQLVENVKCKDLKRLYGKCMASIQVPITVNQASVL